MGYTEKYVTVTGAGAHDGSDEANAWTLAEAVAAAAAGDRVNIKAGTYALTGNVTLPGGTVVAPICWRGYYSTIGDLTGGTWAATHTAAGFLSVTNFPVIAGGATYRVYVRSFARLMGVSITGSRAGDLLDGTSATNVVLYRVKVNNSGFASAATNFSSGYCAVIDCDLDGITIGGEQSTLFANRVTASSGAAVIVNITGRFFVAAHNLIYDAAGGISITVQANCFIANNTFDNISGRAISVPNVAHTNAVYIVVNNQGTNCATFMENLRTATQTVPVIAFNNRLRDNTNNYVGFFANEGVGDILTDDADANEYSAVASDDYRLLSGALGSGAGLPAFLDTGCWQRENPTDAEIAAAVWAYANRTLTP